MYYRPQHIKVDFSLIKIDHFTLLLRQNKNFSKEYFFFKVLNFSFSYPLLFKIKTEIKNWQAKSLRQVNFDLNERVMRTKNQLQMQQRILRFIERVMEITLEIYLKKFKYSVFIIFRQTNIHRDLFSWTWAGKKSF